MNTISDDDLRSMRLRKTALADGTTSNETVVYLIDALLAAREEAKRLRRFAERILRGEYGPTGPEAANAGINLDTNAMALGGWIDNELREAARQALTGDEKWIYEDQLQCDITPEYFARSRVIDGVRMYPPTGDKPNG